MTHTISNKHLTIEKVNEIISKGLKLELSQESEAAIVKCRKFLDSKMEDIGRPVYGVTTGFGSLCNITIPAEDLSQLQHNLVMSHACGTGETVRPEIVKLMLLLKVQSLSYGYSGVQLITVQRLIDMFNNDILPVVYSRVRSEHPATSLPSPTCVFRSSAWEKLFTRVRCVRVPMYGQNSDGSLSVFSQRKALPFSTAHSS